VASKVIRVCYQVVGLTAKLSTVMQFIVPGPKLVPNILRQISCLYKVSTWTAVPFWSFLFLIPGHLDRGIEDPVEQSLIQS
jgi:hypothetical protein